ncbi:Endonuclease-reverse transcriptase, partial [Operophtera brumata]
GSYKLDKTKKSRATYKNRKPPLTNEENARQYLEVLKEGVLELTWQEHDNIESYYKKIESTVIQSLSSVNSTETTKNIISQETKEMIKRRAELQDKHPRSKEEKKVLSDLYKTTNKLLKKDYEKHRMDTIEENLRKKRSQKRAYKQLDSNKTWVQKLKTSQSSLRYTETRTDIVKTATEYYRELYSCQIYDEIPKNPTETELVQLVEPFKEIEIVKKIVALKPEKSPGPDGIPNEAVNRATYKNRKPPLTNEENARQYLEVLKEGVLELTWQEHDNIESYYKKIESTVIQSLSSVNSTETTKNIISQETKEMIKRRAELQGKHPRSKEEKKVLSDLYKTTNKLLKKDYEKHRMDTIEENLRKKRSQKRAYKQLDSNKTWVQKLKTSQSSLRYTETRTDIVKTATEYYRELYSCQIYDEIPKNPTETELVQLVEPFKEIKILKKIVALKPEKSPGPDGIPNEAV